VPVHVSCAPAGQNEQLRNTAGDSCAMTTTAINHTATLDGLSWKPHISGLLEESSDNPHRNSR
jgi:hypothetical protein